MTVPSYSCSVRAPAPAVCNCLAVALTHLPGNNAHLPGNNRTRSRVAARPMSLSFGGVRHFCGQERTSRQLRRLAATDGEEW